MDIHVNGHSVRTSIRIPSDPCPISIYLDIHTDSRADVCVELSVLRTVLSEWLTIVTTRATQWHVTIAGWVKSIEVPNI